MKKSTNFILGMVFIGSFFAFYKFSNTSSESKMIVKEEETPTDWFFKQRAFPYDNINYKAYKEVLTPAIVDKQVYRNSSVQQSWKFAGSVNIGGRITDIEMHASDQQTIYAGSATGGVFKSTNAGTSWFPIFDKALSLSIGDIAIAPSDPKILYVGTGEANGGGGSTTYDGLGVYKSSDAGASWAYVGLDNIGNTGSCCKS